MEHTWTLGGGYANWTMTITATAPDRADPPEEPTGPDFPEFPTRQFENLGRQFHDAVNLFECLRYEDELVQKIRFGTIAAF